MRIFYILMKWWNPTSLHFLLIFSIVLRALAQPLLKVVGWSQLNSPKRKLMVSDLPAYTHFYYVQSKCSTWNQFVQFFFLLCLTFYCIFSYLFNREPGVFAAIPMVKILIHRYEAEEKDVSCDIFFHSNKGPKKLCFWQTPFISRSCFLELCRQIRLSLR